MSAASLKHTLGMEGARVQLPSGRWLNELTNVAKATPEEVAWVVAHYMFSHSQDGGWFYGSAGTALRACWDGQQVGNLTAKAVPKYLNANGFRWDPDPDGRPRWKVPDVLGDWKASSSTADDGGQTTGGPVRVRKVQAKRHTNWTTTMVQLLAVVHQQEGLHPREYGELLGWDEITPDPGRRVSSVGRTLKQLGYIRAEGHTEAARYFPTDKQPPARVLRLMLKSAGQGPSNPSTQQPVEPEPAVTPASQVPAPPPTPVEQVSTAVEQSSTPPPFLEPSPELLRHLAAMLEVLAPLSRRHQMWLLARLSQVVES